jgi:hypothetical protein
MGQCDYAMSNEILNKVANLEAKKRGEGCIVKSINWGPWEGGMVTPFLKKHMQQMGIPLIPLEEGQKLWQSLPGKNKKLTIIPLANHNNLMLVGFKQYFAALGSFVR